eukprot:Seg3739.2 transcript_id=Seg3739.2/GoldUCD/mRNA.D3Y31 product="hypothetical protein" protein_id=Seg3739.2/GoldUCD/D3Y31
MDRNEFLNDVRLSLDDISAVFSHLESNSFSRINETELECLLRRANELCQILSIFKADLLLLLHGPNEHLQAISSVLDELELLAHRYKSQYQERLDLLSLQSLASQQHPNQQAHSGRNHGKPGRPRFLACKEQITGLINLGFSFTKIGSMLGVHPRTLRKMRSEIGLPIGTAVYSQVTDGELKLALQEILQAAPNTGERLMQGALRAKGIRIQRERMRQALQILDPVGRALRKRLRIRRRIYNVPCANALWHADGYHKLIRWRLVIHGCIDGYFRLITFLQCSTNNKAETVLSLFLKAIQNFRCPLRMRTDHGTENIAMAEWLLNHHGVHKHPVLTGKSVHNQRIERLWVDMSATATSHFLNLFYYMESIDKLDPDNEVHLYALHFVYQQRINNSLILFQEQWNHHPMRTIQNKSPLQMWTDSFYTMTRFSREPDDLLQRTSLENDYGIDDEGPIPDLQTRNHVVVPRSDIELNETEHQLLTQTINYIEEDGKHGMQVYINAVQFIENLLQRS